MSGNLVLHLRAEYFHQIKSGKKPYEYRLCTPYWTKRLVGREYDQVIFCNGYPGRNDSEKRIIQPYRGYFERVITHPHFGPAPVQVFAIKTMEGGAA